MQLECSNRVLLIRGRENDFGQPFHSDGFEDSETIHLRHLHIEKNEIGISFSDRGDSLFAICAFADDLNLVIVAQHSANEFPRERFILDDQSSNALILHRWSSSQDRHRAEKGFQRPP